MSDSARRWACVAIFVAAFVSLLPYCTAFHSGMNDEAIVVTAAERILDGEVPYRDFDMFYPPGPELVTAAWIAVGGRELPTIRLLVAFTAASIAVVIFLLGLQLLDWRSALVAPVLFILSGMSEWPVVSYHWMGGAGLMACTTCVVVHARAPRNRWLFLAGVCAGAAGACVQTEGVAAVVVAVVSLAWLRLASPRAAGLFVAGVALVWVPLVAWIVVTGGLPEMITNLFTRAVSGLFATRGSPYDPRHVTGAWEGIAASWPDAWGTPQILWATQAVSMASVWTLKYLFYFPVLLWAGVLGYRRGGPWRVVVVLWVVWTLAKLDRFDMLYANYLTPAWYVAVGLIVDDLMGRPRAARILASLLALPFVVTFAFALRGCSDAVHPVHTRAGTLYTADAEQARLWDGVFRQACAVLPPGSLAFAWPYSASFYPLTATRNATRMDFLVPLQHDAGQIDRAAADLRRREVPFIFYFPFGPDLFQDYPRIDPVLFKRETERMNAALTEGYREAAVVGPMVAYRRR